MQPPRGELRCARGFGHAGWACRPGPGRAFSARVAHGAGWPTALAGRAALLVCGRGAVRRTPA
eukprot:13330118-Alexandrium_andersonii.AAC.1